MKMTDSDIFEKYKLVPHYVIKRTSLNNYRKKIKEYLSVSFEENNTLDCVTFKCKDDKSTLKRKLLKTIVATMILLLKDWN